MLGVVAAVVFTLFVSGFALFFVVPIVFIGSCTASVAFVWGLVGYLVLQQINGVETPVRPGTKVSNSLNALTDGRLRDLVDRAGPDSQPEDLAVNLSRDTKASLQSQVERGHCEARSGSPHRRQGVQINGTRDDGGLGEEGQEDRAPSATVGTRDPGQGARDRPDAHITTYNPVDESVVDWKTQFQREGTAT